MFSIVYLLFFANLILLGMPQQGNAQNKLKLSNTALQLEWQKSNEGYRLTKAGIAKDGKTIVLDMPSGEYTVLYSANKPDSLPLLSQVGEHARNFPEPIYKYLINNWQNNLKPVPMNTAGTALQFYPAQGKQSAESAVHFSYDTKQATIQAKWSLDPVYKNDVVVEMQLTAKEPGYFSMATPSLATLAEKDMVWGMIPGYFQGKSLQDDLVLSYAYGQGIPRKPIIVRERTTSTLSPLLSHQNGLTLAVIPEPGTGRNPWEKDKNSHSNWQLGLSLMNRRAALTPTAYHPVLGEKDSYMKAGQTRSFSFRYTLQAADWYTIYKHAIYDIYHFKQSLALKQTRQSLTDRIQAMHQYLNNDTTSLWRTEQFQGKEIGAQAYLGGVVGADKDAMKNSDYGAMWMLATFTGDPVLKKTRLPFAKNFKLVQQQQESGFFQGAAVGQYYLSKSRKFTEEWGPYVEPIGLTYYSMLDIGNMLLFEPDDKQLRERLQLGAERLLNWQHTDGHWEVAYDRQTEQQRFTDLQDLRPTFYGLIVAYRILGDNKYLEGAKKGANWFIQHAVNQGHFLGVCGDVRFVPDFATGQSVQALLDLYELTQDNRYKDAALTTAKIYTASIYTHPIPSREQKIVNGTTREDWEISQVGLSFEHGGSIGSATNSGPILLASHAGMFVRLFALTGDSLYIDMARAGAWGRDAFVHQPTSVASYYWRAMDAGSGPFPHHAWWQIGWLTDYLLSEIALRSGGKIHFPRGFITPKVGPHQSYGFAPGTIFGNEAALHLPTGMLDVANPQVDYIGAISTTSKKAYVLLLNNDDEAQTTQVAIYSDKLLQGKETQVLQVKLLNRQGKLEKELPKTGSLSVQLPAFGLAVVEIVYQEGIN